MAGNYENSDNFIVSNITLNPWQDGTVGYDTNFADEINEELNQAGAPEMYARVLLTRTVDLEAIKNEGFSEEDYLKDIGKIDTLYEEGERKLQTKRFRVYGNFETPAWAQELNKFGVAEGEEITLNFNIKKLESTLTGSVLHMGDLVQLFDTINGWKYYEVMNALPVNNFLGQYLMWQVIAKKTDLEGYIELENADIDTHPTGEAPPTTNDPVSEAPSNKPRPKVY
jgi:hypothetical protein